MYLSVKSVSSGSCDTHCRSCRRPFFLPFDTPRTGFRMRLARSRDRQEYTSPMRNYVEKTLNRVPRSPSAYMRKSFDNSKPVDQVDSLRYILACRETKNPLMGFTRKRARARVCPLIFPRVNMAIKRHASLFWTAIRRGSRTSISTSCLAR